MKSLVRLCLHTGSSESLRFTYVISIPKSYELAQMQFCSSDVLLICAFVKSNIKCTISYCLCDKSFLNPCHVEYFYVLHSFPVFIPLTCSIPVLICKHVFSIRVENIVDLDLQFFRKRTSLCSV